MTEDLNDGSVDISWELFFHHLRDVADTKLDQWEYFQIESRFGPVYVYLGRAPLQGTSESDYQPISTKEAK